MRARSSPALVRTGFSRVPTCVTGSNPMTDITFGVIIAHMQQGSSCKELAHRSPYNYKSASPCHVQRPCGYSYRTSAAK